MRILLIFFLSLVAVKGYGQRSDTFQVHFGLNETKLGKRASDFIDRLIFKDVLIHGQKLIVLGYADYLGSNAHNDSLSTARAKSVKDYLLDAGFDPKDIKLCIGKGEIDRTPVGKGGYAHDRKVQIVIDRGKPAAGKVPAVMDVTKVKVNQTVALKNIGFEAGTAVFLSKSFPTLNSLYQILIDNKRLTIQIEGHVCCMPRVGDDDNFLSVDRAMSVYKYLISRGIAKERLKYVGLGNRDPIYPFPERNPEEAETNRRVEIRILSK